MSEFLDYIGKNYEGIKKNLQSYKNFDEDIFHSTIIKCEETIKQNGLTFNSANDMHRYFIGAYKTNLLRENLYYYHKNVDKTDQTIDCQDGSNIVYQVDIEIITDDIAKTFGEDLKEAYINHLVEDISIANLQKRCGIKNLKQKLKNIKEYLCNKYTNRDRDSF